MMRRESIDHRSRNGWTGSLRRWRRWTRLRPRPASGTHRSRPESAACQPWPDAASAPRLRLTALRAARRGEDTHDERRFLAALAAAERATAGALDTLRGTIS